MRWFKRVYNYWRRYYYFNGDADVLIFFDMSSLTQSPRTPDEDKDFRIVLKQISNLYSIFPVLVIDEIPQEVKFFTEHVDYVEKGWCWTELNIAAISGKLTLLSGDTEASLQAELWVDSDLSNLHGMLAGQPPLPLAIYNNPEQLLRARRTQQKKGKVFTCGATDFHVVKRQLLMYHHTASLTKHIVECDIEGVRNAVDAFLQDAQTYGLRTHDLVNAVIDDRFSTPLHLAVRCGSEHIVEFLVANGAENRRNVNGDLPWEKWGLPWFWRRLRMDVHVVQNTDASLSAGGVATSLLGQSVAGLGVSPTTIGALTLEDARGPSACAAEAAEQGTRAFRASSGPSSSASEAAEAAVQGLSVLPGSVPS